MKTSMSKGRRAFTLVELLLVVLILAALAAIAIPRIAASATEAKKNACKSNISTMNTQIELFTVNTGTAPTLLTDVTGLTTYFPDGAPVCPFGVAYAAALVNGHVDTSTHTH